MAGQPLYPIHTQTFLWHRDRRLRGQLSRLSNLCVYLDDISEAEVDAYLQAVQEAGFQSVHDTLGIATENAVALGELFYNGEVSLSVAASGSSLSLAISLPE